MNIYTMYILNKMKELDEFCAPHNGTQKARRKTERTRAIMEEIVKGFVKSKNAIRLSIIRECGCNAYVLYLNLLSHRNAQTNKCYPTREILAKEMNCNSSRNISYLLKKLKDAEYICIEEGQKGQANSYTFPQEEFTIDRKKELPYQDYADMEDNDLF